MPVPQPPRSGSGWRRRRPRLRAGRRAALELLEEGEPARGVGVAQRRQLDARRPPRARLEADVDRVEPRHAPDHEAAAHQQDERERHLGHERAPRRSAAREPRRGRARPSAATVGPHPRDGRRRAAGRTARRSRASASERRTRARARRARPRRARSVPAGASALRPASSHVARPTPAAPPEAQRGPGSRPGVPAASRPARRARAPRAPRSRGRADERTTIWRFATLRQAIASTAATAPSSSSSEPRVPRVTSLGRAAPPRRASRGSCRGSSCASALRHRPDLRPAPARGSRRPQPRHQVHLVIAAVGEDAPRGRPRARRGRRSVWPADLRRARGSRGQHADHLVGLAVETDRPARRSAGSAPKRPRQRRSAQDRPGARAPSGPPRAGRPGRASGPMPSTSKKSGTHLHGAQGLGIASPVRSTLRRVYGGERLGERRHADSPRGSRRPRVAPSPCRSARRARRGARAPDREAGAAAPRPATEKRAVFTPMPSARVASDSRGEAGRPAQAPGRMRRCPGRAPRAARSEKRSRLVLPQRQGVAEPQPRLRGAPRPRSAPRSAIRSSRLARWNRSSSSSSGSSSLAPREGAQPPPERLERAGQAHAVSITRAMAAASRCQLSRSSSRRRRPRRSSR